MHFGPFGNIANCIAQHVVDRPAQQLRIREKSDVAPGSRDTAVGMVCLKTRILDDPIAQSSHRNGRECLDWTRSRFHACKQEKLLHQVAELVGLAFNSFQLRRIPAAKLTAQEGEGEMQTSQRRSQLVGDVRDKAALGRHQRLDLRGHGVKVARARLIRPCV